MAVVGIALAAAAAATTLSVTAPAPVTALAADGYRVAFAVGRSGADCDRVRIWERGSGRVVRLGRKTHCVETSTGSGIAALSLAGARALWLHYSGGNIREWSLWTATTTQRMPRRLAFVARGVDEPPPIVVGHGDSSRLGDLLPYAIGRTVIALRANGSRRFSWTAPARVVALSALGGELAVASEGGRVTVLDAAGRVRRSVDFEEEIRAVRIGGSDVLVQTGRTLRAGGPGGRTWPLPAGARLVDATGDRAFYVARGRVRAIRLSGRRDEVVATGSHAQVEGLWLAVASGRRVVQREPVG